MDFRLHPVSALERISVKFDALVAELREINIKLEQAVDTSSPKKCALEILSLFGRKPHYRFVGDGQAENPGDGRKTAQGVAL